MWTRRRCGHDADQERVQLRTQTENAKRHNGRGTTEWATAWAGALPTVEVGGQMKDECIMDHQNVATEQRKAAKARMVAGLLRGQPWQTAAATAGVRTSRTTAYRWREKVRMQGENGLSDGRHGHPSKLRAPIQQWLEGYCRGAPGASGASGLMVQAALHEQSGSRASWPVGTSRTGLAAQPSHCTCPEACCGARPCLDLVKKGMGTLSMSREGDGDEGTRADRDLSGSRA